MSKLKLLCKPCQSGKTADILNNIKDNSENKHIIISDNNLLLNTQTYNRALEQGLNCVMISSDSEYSNIVSLLGLILLDNTINLILVCGNSKRLNDITILITSVNKYNYTIWIDEADKIVNSGKSYEFIETCVASSNVTDIVLITATPQESLKKSLISLDTEIRLTTNINRDLSMYHSFKESNFIEAEHNSSDLREYIDTYLSANKPKNSEVWFIPGRHTIENQNELYTMLLTKYFDAILLINSKHKIIGIVDRAGRVTKINLKQLGIKKSSVSHWLGTFYEEHGLSNKRMAITGNTCVGRGISIQSNKCYITHALLGPGIANNKRKLYQMSARICGNIKSFSKYKSHGSPKVITSSHFYNTICKMEAISLGTMNHKEESIDIHDIHNFYESSDELEMTKEPTIIKKKTIGEIKTYINLQTNNDIFTGKRGPNKKKTNDQGRYEYKILGTKKCWTTKEIFSLRKKINKKGFICVPCYQNIRNPESVEWWLIY